MAGIAEQRRAALRPGLQRLAADERPFERLIDVADDLVDERVPARKIGGAFRVRATLGPGFLRPVGAFAEADEIEDLAAPQRIGDDVPARAEPVGAHRPLQFGRQRRHRREAAPRDDAEEARARIVEHLAAQARMHTVRADEHVAGDAPSVFELERHARAVLHETDTARAGVDRVGLQRGDRVAQHTMQIAAMHEPVGRAEPVDRIFTEVEQLVGAAGIPDAHFLERGRTDDGLHRGLQAEVDQHARAVRRDLDAGTDFGEFARLLVDIDVETAPQQREGRRQSADTTASDENMRVARHVAFLPIRS